MPDITVSGIIERDVDFLLMEELASSPDFLRWFAQKAGLECEVRLESITHSSTSATGETDIEVHLEAAGGTTFILLENKVDAPLQPRQAERYRERAQRYAREGACTHALSGLVAPAKYLGEDPSDLGFDFTVQYEQILDWYEQPPTPRDARPFRSAILRRALDRGTVGWTLIPNESVTEFWRRYWELVRALAPELQMPKPTVKAETSAFVFFRPSALPKGVKLIHKARYGNVDIQFDGRAAQIDAITAKYGPRLEPGMSITQAGKSAVVRIEVPTIDLTAPFADSEATAREGIWAARLLLLWYRGLPQDS